MRFEKSLLDKILSKGLLGKRALGRPLKHNTISKHGRGVLELMYKPRNNVERIIGRAIHGFLPILSYFSYRFQVERSRIAGLRVEDNYDHKFFREPYITWHIYAQHFHPWTLNERIRDVHFYRKTNTLFKGFAVPDWAQSHRRYGFDVDVYSRTAWKNAMKDMVSEFTPMPFTGERVEPNCINWARIEHVGKGYSSKLFYNEIPTTAWHRHGGHLDDKEKTLYSFKYADQDHEDVLGFDVSTAEGKKALDAEVERFKRMTPEIHESFKYSEGENSYNNNRYVSTEAHFQRVWNHYRQYLWNKNLDDAIARGDITHEDVNSARSFFDESGLPSANLLSMGQKGMFGVDDPAYEAFQRVLSATNLRDVEFNYNTSEPLSDQLLNAFDKKYEVTERKLVRDLPIFVSDPKQRGRVEALLESGGDLSSTLPEETTRQLA